MKNSAIINVIGFYICWWLTIYGAVSKLYYIGPVATFIFIIIHLGKLTNHKKEDIFLLISFFLGLFIETLLLNLDIIIHKGILVKYNIAPFWSVSLWLCFATTLLHSFKWLSKRYLTSSLLGILSAPMIYFSMQSMDVVTFGADKIIVIIFTSFLWGLFFPLYIYISDRILES
ncbi:DUF2878 domain-containing protein [Candidatus Marinimicrobia bacterium]|nr:DUF2878 domain-containing protein [Candidatus Neomarinimicrobiota bacterium]